MNLLKYQVIGKQKRAAKDKREHLQRCQDGRAGKFRESLLRPEKGLWGRNLG